MLIAKITHCIECNISSVSHGLDLRPNIMELFIVRIFDRILVGFAVIVALIVIVLSFFTIRTFF